MCGFNETRSWCAGLIAAETFIAWLECASGIDRFPSHQVSSNVQSKLELIKKDEFSNEVQFGEQPL